MKPPLVLVEWLDAFAARPMWRDPDEFEEFLAEETYQCQTVGWLQHEDDDFLTIVSQRSGHQEQVFHIQRIPQGCVTRVARLVVGRAVRR